jgi:tetratricopeptide (TPR) repeat protein
MQSQGGIEEYDRHDMGRIITELWSLDSRDDSTVDRRIELSERALTLLDGKEPAELRVFLYHSLVSGLLYILETDRVSGGLSGLERIVAPERSIGLLLRTLGDLANDNTVGKRLLTHIELMMAYHMRVLGSVGSNERRAIKYGKEAIALASPDENLLLWAEANLRLAMIYAAGFTGNRTERADEAIRMLNDVALALSEHRGSELWCRVMANLGEAHSFRPHGDRNVDLARAEEYFNELAAVETLETNPAGWASTQLSLAGVRLKRFDADGALACLELARDGYQRAGVEAPSNFFNVLANAYRMNDDSERAIFFFRKRLAEIVREVRPVIWARSAMRLASAVQGSDPQEASKLLHEAVEALEGETAATRDRTEAFRMLANTYLRENSPEGLREAITWLEAAQAEIRDDLPEVYVAICDKLARAYAQADRWTDAARTYEAAVEVLDRRYQMLMIFRSRAEDASAMAGLRHRAAYALARCGRNDDALLMLESARARILGESLARDNADLEEVARADPDVHAAFVSAAEQVRAVELHGRELAQITTALSAGELRIDEMARTAYAALNAATNRIRDLPGMEHFLARPRIEDISVLPQHAIVYVVSTIWGSLVLTVSRLKPGTQLDITSERVDSVTSADLSLALDIGTGSAVANIPAARLIAAIDQIGDGFAHVLAEIVHSSVLRVIMVPCGLLGVLPMHLLWTAPGGERRLIDELPVVQALSGRRITSTDGVHRSIEPFVVVSNPGSDLRYADEEASAIGGWYTEKALLAGSAASIAAVRAAAKTAGGIHLACHGKQDPASPLSSGLELADGRLTVAQLLAGHPPAFAAARLIVMSSCDSAAIDPGAPDEVVGLPAAMTYAGASAVMGSLWRIDDAAAAIFMAGFYARLHASGLTIAAWAPADMMRETQLWMRDVTADELLTSMQRLSPEMRAWLRLFEGTDTPFADPRHWAAFTILGV